MEFVQLQNMICVCVWPQAQETEGSCLWAKSYCLSPPSLSLSFS